MSLPSLCELTPVAAPKTSRTSDHYVVDLPPDVLKLIIQSVGDDDELDACQFYAKLVQTSREHLKDRELALAYRKKLQKYYDEERYSKTLAEGDFMIYYDEDDDENDEANTSLEQIQSDIKLLCQLVTAADFLDSVDLNEAAWKAVGLPPKPYVHPMADYTPWDLIREEGGWDNELEFVGQYEDDEYDREELEAALVEAMRNGTPRSQLHAVLHDYLKNEFRVKNEVSYDYD